MRLRRRIEIVVNKVYDHHERNLRITEIPNEDWQAIRQVILEELESATEFAVNDQTAKDSGLLAHSTGVLHGLRGILALLEEARTSGKKLRGEDDSTS